MTGKKGEERNLQDELIALGKRAVELENALVNIQIKGEES